MRISWKKINFAQNFRDFTMITASNKKRENIAEYLLYMWQIEDVIRANNLDIDKIKANIIDQYKGLTEQQVKDMTDWYDSLIDMMRREDVQQKGHLQINKNVLTDLEELSQQLLSDPKFNDYSRAYYNVLPDLVELRAKAGDNKKAEIETAFEALYGLLLLRLTHKEISAETLAAAKRISSFLALLASYYKKDYNNELFKDEQ